jgi:hypothetical protein
MTSVMTNSNPCLRQLTVAATHPDMNAVHLGAIILSSLAIGNSDSHALLPQVLPYRLAQRNFVASHLGIYVFHWVHMLPYSLLAAYLE